MSPEVLYPTVAEFKSILLREQLEVIVSEHILEGAPYVFRDHPETLQRLREHLTKALGVSEKSILIVGSGRIGFSLSPDTFPHQFSEDSDIDVIVYDEELFDKIWMAILRWHYPSRYAELRHPSLDWAGKRKKDIYWGWLQPDKIQYDGLVFPNSLKPLRDISTRWFNAFQSLTVYEGLSKWTISGRLYRTLEHARLYHLEGLRRIKESLQQME